MFIKLSFSGTVSASRASDLLVLLLTHHKSITNISSILNHADLHPSVKAVINLEASELNLGAALGTTVTINEHTTSISFPILNSAKRKNLEVATSSSNISYNIADGSFLTTSSNTSAISAGQNMILSISDRHAFWTYGTTAGGMFEFVANDGFYTESSQFKPYGITVTDWYKSFGSSFRPLTPTSTLNVKTQAVMATTAAALSWETPFGHTSHNTPDTNGGYDFLSNNSEKTPILIPFGVQQKVNGIIGGSISELCDFYLGPTDLAGAYETVAIGDDSYCCLPIGSSAHMLYIPKW